MADAPKTAGWSLAGIPRPAYQSPNYQSYDGVRAPYANIEAQIHDTMMMSGLLPGYPPNPLMTKIGPDGKPMTAPNQAGRYSFGGGGGYGGAYGLLGGGSPAGGPPPGYPPPPPGGPPPPGNPMTPNIPGGNPGDQAGFLKYMQGIKQPGLLAGDDLGYAAATGNQGALAKLLANQGGDSVKLAQQLAHYTFSDPAKLANAGRSLGMSDPAMFARAQYQAQGLGKSNPDGSWTWSAAMQGK